MPKIIIDFLEKHPQARIAVIGHNRPDGDALGSCMALAEILNHTGRRAAAVNLRPIPDRLRFIVHSDISLERDAKDWWREFDVVGILDCGEIDRLDEINREAAANLPTFNIDHHISSRGIGDVVWNNPTASSTGEMLVHLALTAGWIIPTRAAQALWTAILTDTGRFSYENTSPDALEAARQCLLAGADPNETATNVYHSTAAAERFLQGRVLSRLELRESGRLALSWLCLQDFAEAGPGSDTTQDLVNLLRDTAGVDVSIMLKESTAKAANGEQLFKASIRTVCPHDATKIAERFGGGGHIRAAGCALPGPLEEAKKALFDAAAECCFGKS